MRAYSARRPPASSRCPPTSRHAARPSRADPEGRRPLCRRLAFRAQLRPRQAADRPGERRPSCALAAARGGFGAVTDLGCGRGQVGLSLLAAGLATRVHRARPRSRQDRRRQPRRRRPGRRLRRGATSARPRCRRPIPSSSSTCCCSCPAAAQQRAAGADGGGGAAPHRDPCLRPGPGLAQRRRRRDGTAGLPHPPRRLRPSGRCRWTSWRAPLVAAGFRISVTPCWGWTPLPNVMLVAERDGPEAAQSRSAPAADRSGLFSFPAGHGCAKTAAAFRLNGLACRALRRSANQPGTGMSGRRHGRTICPEGK